jgi:RecB family endonuclease NucS
MIGKITRVNLKEVWKHEALDFTKWLIDNIDMINDLLDLNLSNAEREKAAGDFNVDIVAQDGNGNLVIFENKL